MKRWEPSEDFRWTVKIERLALTRAEAADCLGMSINSFERYVQPEIKMVRRGSLRVVPVTELQRWLDVNAESVLPPEWVERARGDES